jgi:hypothetical protein
MVNIDYGTGCCITDFMCIMLVTIPQVIGRSCSITFMCKIVVNSIPHGIGYRMESIERLLTILYCAVTALA